MKSEQPEKKQANADNANNADQIANDSRTSAPETEEKKSGAGQSIMRKTVYLVIFSTWLGAILSISSWYLAEKTQLWPGNPGSVQQNHLVFHFVFILSNLFAAYFATNFMLFGGPLGRRKRT